jgi:uncharacterized protein YuzE
MIVELAERGSAYIRYLIGEPPVGPTIEVGGEGAEVLVDLNADGAPIGIEIVDVMVPENVRLAKKYAVEHGLPFPNDIVAAARSVSTT